MVIIFMYLKLMITNGTISFNIGLLAKQIPKLQIKYYLLNYLKMQHKTDQYLVEGASFNRLLKEYDTHKSLVIGCDFDGTLRDYHNQGNTYEMVRQLLRDLKAIGCKIIIWTAFKDHVEVEQICKHNNIPFDGINTDGIPLPWESRKPFFSAILDDRSGLIQVYNDLTLLVETIKSEN